MNFPLTIRRINEDHDSFRHVKFCAMRLQFHSEKVCLENGISFDSVNNILSQIQFSRSVAGDQPALLLSIVQ